MSEFQIGRGGQSNSTGNPGIQNPEANQLSRLSSVLNGLEGGASRIRLHTQEAMKAVQAGTYNVDPMQLSRRIVGDALRAI